MKLLPFFGMSVLTAMVMSAGCASHPAGHRAAGPLLETTWVVESIRGEPVTVVDPMHTPQIVLRKAEQRVVAHGGVNRVAGTYRLDGDRLTFGPLVSTKMAGPEPMNRQEMAFLQTLEKVNGYAIRDGGLALLENGASVMMLRPE